MTQEIALAIGMFTAVALTLAVIIVRTWRLPSTPDSAANQPVIFISFSCQRDDIGLLSPLSEPFRACSFKTGEREIA
jgi:hypothetical protein